MKLRLWTTLLAAFGVVSAGCSIPPQEADFDSISPVERTMAIEQAARNRDLSSVHELISELDSQDAAVRMMAISTLRDLTGQDLGYNATDPEPARNAAVDRWEAWAGSEKAPNRLPSTGDSLPGGGHSPNAS